MSRRVLNLSDLGKAAFIFRRVSGSDEAGTVNYGDFDKPGAQGGSAVIAILLGDLAGIEEHRSLSDFRKVMVHPEIFNVFIRWKQFTEQVPQLRDIPFPAARIIKGFCDGILSGHLKLLVERLAC